MLSLVSLINKKEFRLQLIISIILSLLVITPYIIQINYSTNTPEFKSLITHFKNIEIYNNQEEILIQDLREISMDFPNEVFIVGNQADSYSLLAMIYWGDDIREFVSIEDYSLSLENKSDIFSKKIYFTPNIAERREIWIGGGIGKNSNDDTNYSSIRFAISDEDNISLQNFRLVKEYEKLSVFEKVGN